LDFGTLEIPEIYSIAISNKENYNIYVTGASDTSAIYRLSFEDYSLVNITHDLPTRYGETVPQVYVPASTVMADNVYAVMRGTSDLLKGKAIFKSKNNGDNWTNITGNLPFVPYTTIMVHPRNEDVIVVGTDGFGLYKTIDGGNRWEAWDEGIVKGANFTDMDYSVLNGDSIYVVAATYGSGIYRRHLDDNLAVAVHDNRPINGFKNYCINNALYLKVDEGINKGDQLQIFDAMGRIVYVINDLQPYYFGDNHTIKIDFSSRSNNLYFGTFKMADGQSKSFKIPIF
jgi:hypothetical protein